MRILVGSLWVGAVLVGLPCRGDGTAQPIPFNHRIHTVENALDCDTCHEGVFKRPIAGLPRVEVCMGCHESDITTNPAAEPHIATLRRHAKMGKEIPWVRLYVLPRTVYYSHRRHTAIAKLECPTCHGDIGRSEKPPERPIAQTLEMKGCIRCHERSGAQNDCAWCHR